MANLKGVGGMTQKNLLASYLPTQVTRKKMEGDPETGPYTGEINGAFLDVQIDQSNATEASAKAGECDTNPFLHSEEKVGKDNTNFVSHSVRFTTNQINAMKTAGQEITQPDGRIVIAFKADIGKGTPDANGKINMIPRLPKDLSIAKDGKDFESRTKYNEKHVVGPSDTKLDENTLTKQRAITVLAKENRPVRQPYVAPQAQAEAQVETPSVAETMTAMATEAEAPMHAIIDSVKDPEFNPAVEVAEVPVEAKTADEAPKESKAKAPKTPKAPKAKASKARAMPKNIDNIEANTTEAEAQTEIA